MDISSARLGHSVQVAQQQRVLEQSRTVGAQVAAIIASAPTPTGAVNPPTQGRFIDARA
jgi:hypothetical protein